MALINPTYILILILFIIAVGLGFLIAKVRTSKEEAKNALLEDEAEPKVETFELLPYIEELLNQLNCQYKYEINKEWHEYSFKYQNGNFIIVCKEQDNYIRIHYPHFFSTKIEDLDLVRETCNTCNAHGFSHHVVYTTNGEKNLVSLHITSCIPVVSKNEKYPQCLSENLSHFFTLAQEFYMHFDLTKEKYKELDSHDIEKNFLKYEREFFMLKEMEINHLDIKKQMRVSAEQTLEITEIIKRFYGFEHPELLELKVITHQLRTFVTEEEISKFDISKVLIALDKEGNPNFSGRNATLILTFYNDRNNTEGFPKQLTIALQNEGRTSDVLYQLATLSMPPEEPHSRSAEHSSRNHISPISFLFAFDTPNSLAKRNDLKNLLDKTNQQIQSEDFKNLTDEQIFLHRINTTYLQSYRNCAENLFRQKRYYEAATEFEYLYEYLSPLYLKLNKSLQDFFYEICYYLGFCYCQLNLYKQAYYYLDIVFPLNNMTYMEAYVNNLVNAKDFRSLGIIDNISNAVKSQVQENDGEIPENIKRFLNFLQRRKGHHLIDLGYYDQAREIYEKLYQDSDCQDYALNELAYLQSISEKDKGQDTKSNNIDNK